MKIPTLQIGNITADLPIVQGGMGVRVSLASLASAVAEEGGIGTISSIGLGDIEASKYAYEKMSREALESEIRKAKSTSNGNIAVNFMGVLSNVNDLIMTAIREGIKIIVYGAGLPAKLPGLVEDSSISLVPIVLKGL
jgi:nitronate monooxygenase